MIAGNTILVVFRYTTKNHGNEYFVRCVRSHGKDWKFDEYCLENMRVWGSVYKNILWLLHVKCLISPDTHTYTYALITVLSDRKREKVIKDLINYINIRKTVKPNKRYQWNSDDKMARSVVKIWLSWWYTATNWHIKLNERESTLCCLQYCDAYKWINFVVLSKSSLLYFIFRIDLPLSLLEISQYFFFFSICLFFRPFCEHAHVNVTRALDMTHEFKAKWHNDQIVYTISMKNDFETCARCVSKRFLLTPVQANKYYQ